MTTKDIAGVIILVIVAALVYVWKTVPDFLSRYVNF